MLILRNIKCNFTKETSKNNDKNLHYHETCALLLKNKGIN